MNTSDYQIAARIGEGRRLRDELDRLRRANHELREENESLAAHLDFAFLALTDLKASPEGGRLHLIDGWNLILGAQKEAHSREELIGNWRQFLAEHPLDAAWIVFDGPRENAVNEGRLRISYTGGTGSQRADRFIGHFVRAAKYLGLDSRITVHSHDKAVR